MNGELVDYPKCADCQVGDVDRNIGPTDRGRCLVLTRTPPSPPKKQVHGGFDSDYKSTAPHMKEALGYVMSKFPTAPLWITGKPWFVVCVIVYPRSWKRLMDPRTTHLPTYEPQATRWAGRWPCWRPRTCTATTPSTPRASTPLGSPAWGTRPSPTTSRFVRVLFVRNSPPTPQPKPNRRITSNICTLAKLKPPRHDRRSPPRPTRPTTASCTRRTPWCTCPPCCSASGTRPSRCYTTRCVWFGLVWFDLAAWLLGWDCLSGGDVMADGCCRS